MGWSSRRTMQKPSVAAAAQGVAVTITTQLDAARIIQRTSTTGGGQGKGQASVAMALSFTGTQPIYCRRRSVADGTTILQAAWLANASATTGTITLSGIDVPAVNSDGVTPTASQDGWFYLDVATSASGPWTNSTSSVTAGRLTMVSGQSLAVRMLGRVTDTATNASLGVTISPLCSMLAAYNDPGRTYQPTVATMPWAVPADGTNYDSTFSSEFLRREIGLFGCPAGLIGFAHSSQPLTNFVSPSSDATNYVGPIAARAGGAFEACIWYQGHTEATYGTPPGGYAQALTQLFAYFNTLNSLGSYTKYIGTIPNISNTLWGTPWQRHWIRAGVDQWIAGGGVGTHVALNDIDLIDGVHESQAGAIPMAQHFYRATKTELGGHGDAGPSLVSVSRVGTTITAVFSDVGQTNLVLTGMPANRIFVFPTGYSDKYSTTNNRFPVSTVTVTNKTTLSIVLANDPGDANVLDIWFYWPNDVSIASCTADNIRDNITDGDGIAVGRQIVPNNARVSIAAPNPASTTNAPPGGYVANVAQWAMTETSTTYGAQEEAGFNGTLSGGSATTAASKFPAYNPYTVEFWFTAPASAPASQQYIFGGMGNFIALRTDFKIGFNGATPVLTAGHRYHVACQAGPAGHSIYMTDVTAAGSGTRVYTDSTASTALPTATTAGLRNLNGTGILTQAGATLDELAVFDYLRYSGTTYTAPTAPFTGLEPGLVEVFHLDTSCATVVGN